MLFLCITEQIIQADVLPEGAKDVKTTLNRLKLI